MKKQMIAAVFAFSMSMPAMANDCWVTDKPTGWSVSSHKNYEFQKDSHQNFMICFRENDGTVTGNDLQFVRLAGSTLVGWATNGVGLEVVNVVQIDRVNRKLLFTQTRIGTATFVPLLPDHAGVFTADARPVGRE